MATLKRVKFGALHLGKIDWAAPYLDKYLVKRVDCSLPIYLNIYYGSIIGYHLQCVQAPKLQ